MDDRRIMNLVEKAFEMDLHIRREFPDVSEPEYTLLHSSAVSVAAFMNEAGLPLTEDLVPEVLVTLIRLTKKIFDAAYEVRGTIPQENMPCTHPPETMCVVVSVTKNGRLVEDRTHHTVESADQAVEIIRTIHGPDAGWELSLCHRA